MTGQSVPAAPERANPAATKPLASANTLRLVGRVGLLAIVKAAPLQRKEMGNDGFLCRIMAGPGCGSSPPARKLFPLFSIESIDFFLDPRQHDDLILSQHCHAFVQTARQIGGLLLRVYLLTYRPGGWDYRIHQRHAVTPARPNHQSTADRRAFRSRLRRGGGIRRSLPSSSKMNTKPLHGSTTIRDGCGVLISFPGRRR